MPEGAPENVLERKAQAQRRALGVGAVSVSRSLGRSLSIAADALWALGVHCSVAQDDSRSTDQALKSLSAGQLFVVLEKDESPRALVALDRHLVTGLIEVQTLGKVTQFPLDDRPYTLTDAAMVAPLVDAALPRFSSMLVGQPEHAHVQGYAFGTYVDDIETASLALDAAEMRCVSFDVSLAQNTRQGRAVFLFPEPATTPDHDKANIVGKHHDALMMVPARITAVLTRIHIPLAKVQALRAGDVLNISPNALSTASLVVDGGHVAARGKMGQINGFRAVRLGGETSVLKKPTERPQAVSASVATPAHTDTGVLDAVQEPVQLDALDLPQTVEVTASKDAEDVF